MKACSALAFALGLAALPAWSQSAPEVLPAENYGGAGETGSSGTSASSVSDTGSGGQLITPAIAQSRPAGDLSSTPVQSKTQNDVTYMCGGIGSDESNYMKKTAARDFDLMLTFAAQSGNYVADVDVTIRDARGNQILAIKCDGPILLVDFPRAGTYRIHADVAGHAINKSVQIMPASRTRAMVFSWPRDIAGVEVGGERMSEFGQRRPGDTSSGNGGANGNGAAGMGDNAGSPASSGNGASGSSFSDDHPSKGIR